MTRQAEKRETEAAQKAKNAETRASRRQAVARVEEEWKRIKEAHEANVQAWEVACEKLAMEGVPKKEWPKKPTRPRKPQVPAVDQALGEADDEQDDVDDEQVD